MASDEKRNGPSLGKSEVPLVGDTTTRARNRTVLMSADLAGHVRARLGGEFQPADAERSGGLTREVARDSDGWHAPELDASSVTSAELVSGGEVDVGDVTIAGHNPSSSQENSSFVDAVSEESAEWSSDRRRTPSLRETFHRQESSEEQTVEPMSANFVDDEMSAGEADGEVLSEESSRRIAGPARILRAPPVVAEEYEFNNEPPPATQSVRRPTREFKPMSQEEYLETFVVPPQAEEVEVEDLSDSITWTTESILVGFLISYDVNPKGHYVELRSGRLMVTSEFESSGNCFVVRHPSVSPMHAIMRVGTTGTVQVLDQLSEHGTKIRRAGTEEEEFLSGEKGTLNHGDTVVFGERAFYVCLIKPPTE